MKPKIVSKFDPHRCRRFATAMLLCACVVGAACRVEFGAPSAQKGDESASARPRGKLWVYTSMYRHVVDEFDALMKREHKDIEIEWFVSGSEKVAARVDAELSAGQTRADILLTSDPFFYARMKREERLLPYVSPRALRVPRELADPDGHWVTSRIGAVVIVYNTTRIDKAHAPCGYEALLRDDFKRNIILGDPLSSGTFFATLAFLVDRLGWTYLERLRAHGAIFSGGNTTVIDRVSSGEFSVGLALLENALTATRKGAPLAYCLAKEGAIVVPGPAAILKTSQNPAAAKAFVDVLFSEAGQSVIVRGDMYAGDPKLAAPNGAPPVSDLFEKAYAWSEEFIARTEHGAAELRAEYDRRVKR